MSGGRGESLLSDGGGSLSGERVSRTWQVESPEYDKFDIRSSFEYGASEGAGETVRVGG